MDTQFEEMRQQMTILKKKLDEQEIVNDRIIRKSIKKDISKINNRYTVLCLLALFMIPFSWLTFVTGLGLSKAFGIGTILYFLICMGATLFNGQDLLKGRLMDEDLVEARRKVALAKKRDANWLFFGGVMCVAWLCWFCYEQYTLNGDVWSFIIPVVFGVLIGGSIGLHIHFKTQRQYDEIIDQIEDLIG